MQTTTSESTRSMPLVTSRLATPPPFPVLDLHDAEMLVGWIDGRAIGFRGYGDEAEAMYAAWVAYRTMARRFARDGRRRPVPIGVEPLSLDRRGDVEHILASGRPIAMLVRPGAGSRSGPETYGFELQIPLPVNELTMRSTAYLLYRTLRRAGIRWAMWAPDRSEHRAPTEAAAPSAARANDDAAAPTSPMTPLGGNGDAAIPTHHRDSSASIVGTAFIILAMLAVVVLPAITVSTIVHVLGAAAAVIAVVALASLVRLVVTDVRESSRAKRGERDLGPSPSGAHG